MKINSFISVKNILIEDEINPAPIYGDEVSNFEIVLFECGRQICPSIKCEGSIALGNAAILEVLRDYRLIIEEKFNEYGGENYNFDYPLVKIRLQNSHGEELLEKEYWVE